jgi:hypothetical protein
VTRVCDTAVCVCGLCVGSGFAPQSGVCIINNTNLNERRNGDGQTSHKKTPTTSSETWKQVCVRSGQPYRGIEETWLWVVFCIWSLEEEFRAWCCSYCQLY